MAPRLKWKPGRAKRRALARRLTWGVALLHAALLLTLAVDPDGLPWSIWPFELLWAADRRVMFYPLLAVVLVAPLLTLIAWRPPGRHRYYLLGSWAVTLVLVGAFYFERVALMLEIAWRRLVVGA